MHKNDISDLDAKREITYNTIEFAKLIGVCPRTLARWDRADLFKACRNPAGNPYYTEEQYEAYIEMCHEKATKPKRKCNERQKEGQKS